MNGRARRRERERRRTQGNKRASGRVLKESCLLRRCKRFSDLVHNSLKGYFPDERRAIGLICPSLLTRYKYLSFFPATVAFWRHIWGGRWSEPRGRKGRKGGEGEGGERERGQEGRGSKGGEGEGEKEEVEVRKRIMRWREKG